MPFDMTISLGDAVTALGFIGGAIACVVTIRSNVGALSYRLDRVDAQMDDFKAEMQKLGDVMIELSRTDGRMNLTDDRLLQQGKRLDTMAQALTDLLLGKRNEAKIGAL